MSKSNGERFVIGHTFSTRRRHFKVFAAGLKGLTEEIMGIAQEIEQRLVQAFAPKHLEVRDDSEQHRGHAGWREAGETHFHVTIRADALSGGTRISRHRAVHAALGPDLIARIHALGLTIG
jgi:BolA protein